MNKLTNKIPNNCLPKANKLGLGKTLDFRLSFQFLSLRDTVKGGLGSGRGEVSSLALVVNSLALEESTYQTFTTYYAWNLPKSLSWVEGG